MKKQLLLIAVFIVSALSVNAEDYNSGKIAPMAEETFVLPDFWSGNSQPYYRKGITNTDKWPVLATELGLASDATDVNTIQFPKTGNSDGEIVDDADKGYAKLALQNCGTITVTVWGTGGRGLSIRTGGIGEGSTQLAHNGSDSYKAITVEAVVNSSTPIDIYLLPTGKADGSVSTGDTYISEIIITSYGSPSGIDNAATAKNPVKTEYYNLLGKKFDKAQKGLNIVKVTYDDNSTNVTKAIY